MKNLFKYIKLSITLLISQIKTFKNTLLSFDISAEVRDLSSLDKLKLVPIRTYNDGQTNRRERRAQARIQKP